MFENPIAAFPILVGTIVGDLSVTVVIGTHSPLVASVLCMDCCIARVSIHHSVIPA